jgi:hypothetical protein
MTWSMLLASLRLFIEKKAVGKTSWKRESGLAPLFGGRLPEKIKIRINEEEAKEKKSRRRRRSSQCAESPFWRPNFLQFQASILWKLSEGVFVVVES